jgi:sarcosine oxidase subunit alpha
VPPRRTRAPSRPVTIHLDGEAIVGDADASLTTALVAAGDLLLARSPKFHRPRGPSCMRGGCDGCLMRVDGAPNIMTCMRAAAQGTRVERQNVILTSKVDILRATDWFFPKGMDHHLMFAGIPGVQQVMQAFARRVSGLGELPENEAPVRREGIATITTDVLVIGGGPYGLAAAAALRGRGLDVTLVDDRPSPGGSLLGFANGSTIDGSDVDAMLGELLERASAARVLSESTLIGVLEGNDWIAAHPIDGITRISARARVVATGAHDPTPLFEGNDLPGVISAHAAGRLLREGVLVGEQLVIEGDGPHARAFAVAARAEGARVDVLGDRHVTSVRGMSRVRSVVVNGPAGRAHLDCDAVVFDGPRAPSFELAVQARATTRHREEGYVVLTDESAQCAPELFAIGEVTGAPLAPPAWETAATRVTAAIVSMLGSKP